MKTFDRLVTSREFLDECERAKRDEIVIEQAIVLRSGEYHWRIVGRELSGEKPGSAFANKQSVFKL